MPRLELPLLGSRRDSMFRDTNAASYFKAARDDTPSVDYLLAKYGFGGYEKDFVGRAEFHDLSENRPLPIW